jgi:hypothetical protein
MQQQQPSPRGYDSLKRPGRVGLQSCLARTYTTDPDLGSSIDHQPAAVLLTYPEATQIATQSLALGEHAERNVGYDLRQRLHQGWPTPCAL